MMKKVKMLSSLVFENNFTLQPRQIIELEDNVADNLVKNNMAILIDEPKIEEKIEVVEENAKIIEEKEQPKKEEKTQPKTRKPRKKKDEV